MLRRVDPLGPLFAVLSLAIFLLHGFNGRLARDLALYAYSGQQFAHGVPPYESVMNRAGPLAHVVPGIGSLIADWIGSDDLLTQRTVLMVLSILTVWLTYCTGRDLFESRYAGVIAAATMLTLKTLVLFATGGPREKTTMVLFVTLVVFTVLHQRWMWAGAAIALATLTWQPAFFLTLPLALAAMPWNGRRRILTSVGRLCLGGAIPVAVTVLYFALVGALNPLIEGFLLINAEYTQQQGLVHFFGGRIGLRIREYGPSVWVLSLGLAGAIVNAVVLARGRGEVEAPRARAQISLGVGVVAGVLWSFKAFNGWADSMFLNPVAVLGFTAGVLWLIRRTPWPSPATVIYGGVAVALAAVGAVETRTDELVQQRTSLDTVLAIAGQDATFASVGGPMPLVLTGQTNPVRYQMFKNGFDTYVDREYPGGLAGLAHALDQAHPTFLTMDAPSRYPWLAPTLDRDYVRVGQTLDMVWFASRELGQPTIQSLRSALEQQPASTGN